MKEYYKGVAFPELDKPIEIKKDELHIAKISQNNLDNIKDEILKMIRAVESGQSDICGARIISKNSPLWKVIDGFFNTPTPESFNKFFTILEQELGRRFRLEAMNVALTFKDVQEFITVNKIGILP